MKKAFVTKENEPNKNFSKTTFFLALAYDFEDFGGAGH